jgi:hypothetical protein
VEEDGGRSILEKVASVKQNAVKQAVEAANEIVRGGGSVCDKEKKCLRPLGLEGLA